MTTTFYSPPERFAGTYVTLPADEANHAARVLRHQPGDVIRIADGEGGMHDVRLEQVERRIVSGTVIATHRDAGEPAFHLAMAVAPLKNQGRFETFIEKAVELGVSRIIPIETARGEKSRLKRDRLERITLAAMKQCGRSRLLQIDELVPWASLPSLNEFDRRFVCHERAGRAEGILGRLSKGWSKLLIAVGPEGGFSDEEVESAAFAGFEVVWLGDRRLRAETAAIATAAVVALWSEAGGR